MREATIGSTKGKDPAASRSAYPLPYFLDHPGQDPFAGRNPEALAGDMLPVTGNNSLVNRSRIDLPQGVAALLTENFDSKRLPTGGKIRPVSMLSM